MRTLLTIAIAAAIAFALWALATGPGLIEIIDNPRL
jgi:hypothetical protein